MKLVPIHADGAPAQPLQAIDDVARGVLASTAVLYANAGYAPPWIGYLAVENDAVVGTCAFTAAPRNGAVEIAYYTFPQHERRGVATRMAQSLIDIAQRTDPRIDITAQTLPEDNASTAILRKLDFERIGTATDPDAGLVWVWRRVMLFGP